MLHNNHSKMVLICKPSHTPCRILCFFATVARTRIEEMVNKRAQKIILDYTKAFRKCGAQFSILTQSIASFWECHVCKTLRNKTWDPKMRVPNLKMLKRCSKKIRIVENDGKPVFRDEDKISLFAV